MGNRTGLAETLAQVGGGTVTSNLTYGYDSLYRLTGDGTRSYAYDPVGNRLTLTQGGTTTYSYDRADRILTAGSVSYTVNANGNLTARGADSFAYDQANRLKSATVGGTQTTFVYNGDGQRVSQTTGGATTSYVDDVNQSLPVVLTDGTFKYVYGLGLLYAVDGSGNVQVDHGDGLGSVRAITNASGAVIETYQTDPSGVPIATQGTSTQPFRFTGQQQDPTGLLYLRARYYDPMTGRFLSRDPLAGTFASPRSLNRYAYAANGKRSGPASWLVRYWQNQAETLVGVRFPPSYREFVARYGHGDVGSVEFYGVGESETSAPTAVFQIHLERRYGLPRELIVVRVIDEFLCCLDTSRIATNDEAPVVEWISAAWPDVQKRAHVAPSFADFAIAEIDEMMGPRPG